MNVIPINTRKKGKVYLIGAGPGDPDLITLRGIKHIREADVILYDRLVHPELLLEARRSAELIYVGKQGGKPSTPQEEINRILVEKAKEGYAVARLKGGDPFVFGRGGEELEVLSAAHISYEVIPGISSSIASAAFAGIPLTHRKYSSSFTVITGHAINEQSFPQKWQCLSHCETLVILMGLRKLPDITQKLLENGKPAGTPVAVIEKASYKSQKKIVGTLDDIAKKAKHLSTPATIVIGEVVSLSHVLDWYEPQHSVLTEQFGDVISAD